MISQTFMDIYEIAVQFDDVKVNLIFILLEQDGKEIINF